ncbi:MAG: hypothetical protein GTO02_20905 [Candidatus Dadabacteria bacterium]|nr:hypothetical protein [Candidatus Dadabacteria bacterium]
MPIIQGVVNWACVQRPNEKYEPVWSVDVVLTPETKKKILSNIKEAASKGDKLPKINRNDDGTEIIKIKRKVFRVDGSKNNPPEVVDKSTEAFNRLIGNGSVCNIKYGVYSWKNNFGSGVSLDLKGVQVLKHVPYEDDDENFENLEDTKKSSKKNEEEEDWEDDDLPF